MAKFVSREKLSKKARKELDCQKRMTWAFSPVTKKVGSKKLYNRKKAQRLNRDDFGAVSFPMLLFRKNWPEVSLKRMVVYSSARLVRQ